jgi:SAM-dependent methyltransferase
MADDTTPPLAQRLTAVLDSLGVARAHICARSPLDVLELLRDAPGRLASVTLQGASAKPEEFAALAGRLLWLLGDEGGTARLMAPRLAAAPEIAVHWFKGYAEYGWSDTIVDRTDEVEQVLLAFLAKMDAANALPALSVSGQGEVAGITYRAAGTGTPVVLLPLGLSAHQWDPLLPRLQARHCTIVLAGRHLQPVENLEARAAGSYSRMALDLLDRASPQLGDSLIEVGCGSGALLRRIAVHTGIEGVVGLDVNAFLLREARALAAQEDLADRLDFHEGSAEAIPFPDNSFDVAFSSTVMEEVDADRMLAEMARITKPGGRVAVAVRAVDRGSWTNLPLPKAVKEKIEASTGGVGEKGCADESLCLRFHEAGLKQVQGGPAWSWIQPGDAVWRNTEPQVRGLLAGDEIAAWTSALERAQAAGRPVWLARPFHCAVGTK